MVLETWFHRGDEVVVEQRATWRSPDTGQGGDPQQIASISLVRGGRVPRVTRFRDLADGDGVGVFGWMHPPHVERGGLAVTLQAELSEPLIDPSRDDGLARRVLDGWS